GVVKAVLEIADANLVVVAKKRACLDRLIIQIRAVPASEVFDKELILDSDDAGVLPADGEIVRGEDNIAVGISAEQDTVLLQRNRFFRIGSFNNKQIGHVPAPAPCGTSQLQGFDNVINLPILTARIGSFKKSNLLATEFVPPHVCCHSAIVGIDHCPEAIV